MYFLFCLKEQNNYRIIFEHVADSLKFSRKDRQASLTAVVNKYAQRLEHYCLAYPNQLFNFFDFWQNDQNVIREENSPNSTNE